MHSYIYIMCRKVGTMPGGMSARLTIWEKFLVHGITEMRQKQQTHGHGGQPGCCCYHIDRDNLWTKDKRPVPKVSFVQRFDCSYQKTVFHIGYHSLPSAWNAEASTSHLDFSLNIHWHVCQYRILEVEKLWNIPSSVGARMCRMACTSLTPTWSRETTEHWSALQNNFLLIVLGK